MTRRKKTHEEFIKEVYNLVGDEYSILGEYKNINSKLKMKHNKCGTEYEVKPTNFLSGGTRCPECAKHIVALKQRKSHDEFVKEIFDLIGNEYQFLTKYVNAKTKIKIKHIKCDYVYEATPSHISDNARKGKVYCANCNGTTKSNTNEFKQRVYNLVGDQYKVLGEYINSQTPIKMLHNAEECMHIYYVMPNHFVISNTRCPTCFGKNRLTTEQFKQIVYVAEGNDYLVVGEYENAKTHVKMKHNIESCGHIFESLPTKFIHRNQRCPACNVKSKGEYIISSILNKYTIEFTPQYKFGNFKDTYVLRYDFAVFKENSLLFLIEYDGVQHFQPTDFAGRGEEWAYEQFELAKQRDQIKNQYCRDNNIRLIRIPYWKFDEIETILHKLINNEPIEVDETSFLLQ